MGSVLSISSPFRQLSWKKVLECTNDHSYGKPFVEMIQDHHLYGHLMKVETVYEVKLVHREGCHWYLLLKTKDSTLPYISLEIRTTNLSDLVQFTRNIDTVSAEVSSNVGVYEGTLLSLCQLADRVVKEMDSYDLVCSNCQTFCNELLKKMGKEEFPTSTDFIDREIDLLGEVIFGCSPSKVKNCLPSVSYVAKLNTAKQKRNSSVTTNATGATAGQSAAMELDFMLSKNVPALSIDDLTSLYKILLPVDRNWREIGGRLSVNSQILDTIETNHCQIPGQCLREMLREYLQRSEPPPSWVGLANSVKECDFQVAKSIIKRAKKVRQTPV